MSSKDPSTKKKPLEYSRVIVNVPAGLLEEFDKICALKHYSRVEAIKQSMRNFVQDNLPEGYMTPEESKEQFESMWTGMVDALLKVSSDPKYKELQSQNLIQTQGNQILPTTLPLAPQSNPEQSKEKKHEKK